MVMGKNEIYYQIGRDTVQYQGELNSEFSSKAISLIGYGVAMLAAGAIALNLSDGEILPNIWMWVALSLWVGGFSVIILSSVFVLWPRSWDRGPTVDSLGDLVKNHEYDEDAVLWCVADSFKTAFLSNRKELNKKATAINIAIMAVALEAGGLIFVGVLLFIGIGLHQGSVCECTGPVG